MCFRTLFLSEIRLAVLNLKTVGLKGCFNSVVDTLNLNTKRANLRVNLAIFSLSKKSVVFQRWIVRVSDTKNKIRLSVLVVGGYT
jgi:hypothetical protein